MTKSIESIFGQLDCVAERRCEEIMALTFRKYLLSVPAGNISRSIFIFLKKEKFDFS